MDNVILIKYGELTTKKDNRKEFINILYNNLYEKLKQYDVKIVKEYARMYIYFNSYDKDDILNVLKNTFGIHAFNLCYKVNTNIDDINKDDTYIYFNDIKGLGGYPVGVQKKGLLMLSGGIDSPVAGYLALKRGIKLDAIYFEAIPHTSLNAREKVISLANELLKYTTNINLYVVPITKLQESIYKNIDTTYMITILRRMMYRIAEKIAEEKDYLVLINGESIGQVASQTLSSINVINKVVNISIIRPVACFDKLEIIDIAKRINTYNISILPYEDCCTVFVPKHPVINPKLEKCEHYESLIDYKTMIDECIKNTFVVKINDNEEINDLL